MLAAALAEAGVSEAMVAQLVALNIVSAEDLYQLIDNKDVLISTNLNISRAEVPATVEMLREALNIYPTKVFHASMREAAARLGESADILDAIEPFAGEYHLRKELLRPTSPLQPMEDRLWALLAERMRPSEPRV